MEREAFSYPAALCQDAAMPAVRPSHRSQGDIPLPLGDSQRLQSDALPMQSDALARQGDTFAREHCDRCDTPRVFA